MADDLTVKAVREQILEAVKEARDAGEISLRQALLVRLFSRSAKMQAEWDNICEGVFIEATEAPQVFGADVREKIRDARAAGEPLINAIDWEKLSAFIKEILPVILDFIKGIMVIFASEGA